MENKKMRGNPVSAIVPVFNEEKTVGRVVEALLQSDSISEVICINDGSKDKSLEMLESFGDKIKLINLKRNYGKGFAMTKGIEQAQGEIVAFFDSDLANLSLAHIQILLEPILQGRTRAILGYPVRKGENTNFLPYLTGERAYFKKELLPYLKRLSGTRLGAETFLNTLFKKEEIMTIPLKNLIHLRKYEKQNLPGAVKGFLKEGMEIALEIGKREGILPEDYQKIKDLATLKTLQDFKVKVDEIKNEKVRSFLRKYVLKYVGLAKKKLQDFYKEL